MPQFGLAIVKQVAFRGVQQEFTNVYHYKSPNVGIPADPTALINEVVGIEKDLHSTLVTFVRSALWSSGGTKAENQMRDQRALSGTGTQADNPNQDRERAVLMQWPAGLNVLGRPVYLRKWFHSCGNAAGQTFNSAVLRNEDPISTTIRNAIATRCNDLRIIGALDEWLLCAESGREHTAPGTVHRFLEHHQLGDQWR